MHALPVLYSFRRCPYAMRARMALNYANIRVELREVVLKDKPLTMLQASAKGTVPVLVLPTGAVIDESIDIMLWALGRSDPDHWLCAEHNQARLQKTNPLIADNDGPFKELLDKYKYSDRHPQYPAMWYRDQACVFLQTLEKRLEMASWLDGSQLGLSDVAIFPFIRQFVMVDEAWFNEAPYPRLRCWFDTLLQSQLFISVMKKYPKWTPDSPPLWFAGGT